MIRSWQAVKVSALAACLFFLSSCAALGERIRWASYPGAYKQGHCVEYALAASVDLQKRGVPSFYLEFEWREGVQHGAHAVVLFKQDDAWYLVDNQTPGPRLVRGDTQLAMIQQRYPFAVRIR